MPRDRLIKIVRSVETGHDAYNVATVTEQEVARLWAEHTYRDGDEDFDADQRVGIVAVTFKTRFIAGIQLTDRVLYEGARFDVTAVREVGRRAGLEIDAKAVG